MSADLPPNWVAETLDCVAEVHDDLREPVNAEERKGRVGPYPYYGATGQVGWIDDFLMDGEYVLLGEDGAPFLDPSRDKAYLVSGKSWVNNHAHVLRGIDGVCANRFLLHALNHADYRGFANGTTRLKLTQAAMRRLPIRLPPPPEQVRIVAKIEELFSDLDAGVAALERVRANLKRYRAAVLKAAVEGRLTEEWRKQNPATEPAAKLLERILAERRAKWEQGQLRKFKEAGKTPPKGWKEKYEEPPRSKDVDASSLPSTWCWATIDQLIAGDRSSAYGVLQPGGDVPDGVPLVRVCDVADGRVAVDQLKRIGPEIAAQFARTVLRGGEVLLTIVGTIGRTAVAPDSLRGANTARAVAVLPVSEMVPARFVELMLRDSTARAKLTLAAHEVARKTLNLEDVRIACIPIAPPAEQIEIVAEVDRRLSVADAAETQLEHALQRASRLRQAILKRAFEGKLVPQDPTDEPAAALLKRVTSRSNGSALVTGTPARGVSRRTRGKNVTV